MFVVNPVGTKHRLQKVLYFDIMILFYFEFLFLKAKAVTDQIRLD